MSRAAYYREYRKRQKPCQESSIVADDRLDAVIVALQDVAQLLRNTCDILSSMENTVAQQLRNNVADVAQQFATVAQQSATTVPDDKSLEINEVGEVTSQTVAQHVAVNVAQQRKVATKSKRKGFLPPSSPPSPPPHTPPTSSPLLSPHLPKEKPAPNFEISSGRISPDDLPPSKFDLLDYDDQPLVHPGRGSNRDLATHNDLVAATTLIHDETFSHNLVDIFHDWIEYKGERGAKEFYTRKGIIAEARRFIKRHLEGADVAGAINRAIASNWQGWDHDLAK